MMGLPDDLRWPRLPVLPRRFPPSTTDFGFLWALFRLLSKLSDSNSLLGELPTDRLSLSLDVPLMLCCGVWDLLDLLKCEKFDYILLQKYLTIILRNCAEYCLILSRRIPSWLKSGDISQH